MSDDGLFGDRPDGKIIEFSVSVYDLAEVKRLALRAMAIEINADGMVIETGYKLEPGHILHFRSGMDHEFGIVERSRKIGDSYRVDIIFR